MSVTRPLLTASLIGLVAATYAASAGAQVYRIVGPDGRVTFSDKPPVETSAKSSTAPSVPLPGGGSGSALPFELRQIVSRYPVTLYTSSNCVPCGTGKAYLTSRGVPFTEKTVTSQADIEALNRLSGTTSLPFATIGGQQLKGYSEAEWGQFLDAAGYPKESRLPSGYRQAAATPLVIVQEQPAQRAPQAAAAAEAAPAPAPSSPFRAPPPPPANPAGIKF